MAWRNPGPVTSKVAVLVLIAGLAALLLYSFFLAENSTDDVADRYTSEQVVGQSSSSVNDRPKQRIGESEEQYLSWWMKELGLTKRPWKWTWGVEGDAFQSKEDDRALIELLFPCENTCGEVACSSSERKLRSKCRLECKDPLSCLKAQTIPAICKAVREALTDPQAKALWMSEECLREVERFCIEPRAKFPLFEFTPAREKFSIPDIALELARTRKELQAVNRSHVAEFDERPSNNVRILFVGDSVAHEYVQLARCHVMRSQNLRSRQMVTFPKGPGTMYWIPPELTAGREKRNRLEWGMSSEFIIPHEEGPINLTMSFHLANRAIAQDPQLLLDNCLRHDLVVFNWALHYFNPFTSEFEEEMSSVLEQFKRCLEIRPEITIVYANHPMQHFFGTHSKGWYNPNRTDPSCQAMPSGRKIDELDGWSQVIRNIAEQSSSMTEQLVITPIPWGTEARALCPAPDPRGTIRRIFWIPYIELTETFHEMHKPKFGDCTHLVSIPQTGTPLWDALFWSVLQNNNQRTNRCIKTMPVPKFSSLLRHRDENTQRIVNENFREHFALSQAEEVNMFPLITARRDQPESAKEWSRWYEEWQKS